MIAQNLVITNVLTGEKKIIHDIAELPEDLRERYFGFLMNKLYKNKTEYNVTYGYSYDSRSY